MLIPWVFHWRKGGNESSHPDSDREAQLPTVSGCKLAPIGSVKTWITSQSYLSRFLHCTGQVKQQCSVSRQIKRGKSGSKNLFPKVRWPQFLHCSCEESPLEYSLDTMGRWPGVNSGASTLFSYLIAAWVCFLFSWQTGLHNTEMGRNGSLLFLRSLTLGGALRCTRISLRERQKAR